MKIDQYTTTLPATLNKEDLLEDARTTIKTLKTAVGPVFKSAVTDYFNGSNFKSDVVKSYDKEFKRKNSGSKNIFQQISDTVSDVEELQTFVQDKLDESLTDVVASSGLTYMQANLIQLNQFLSFYVQYVLRLQNFLIVSELAEYEDSGVTKAEINDSVSPAEVEWVATNFPLFLQIYPIVTEDVKKVEKSLDNIPDFNITSDNYKTLTSTVGENKLDPLAARFISASINPMRLLVKWWAEWQVEKYNYAKELKEVAELRLLNLKSLEKNNPDPRVQKQIRFYEGRAQRLESKIAEMERNYA